MNLVARVMRKVSSPTGRILASVMLLRLIGSAAGMVMAMMVAAQLSVEQAGLFFLAQAMLLVLASVTRLGLDFPLLRRVATASDRQCWSEVNAAYGFAMRQTGIFSLVMAVALWMAAGPLANFFDKPGLDSLLEIACVSAFAQALLVLHAHALNGLKETIRSVAIGNLLAPSLFVVLLAFGVRDGTMAVAMHAVAFTLALLVAAVVWWRHPWSRWTLRNGDSSMWASCLPLWVSTLFNQLVVFGGQLIAAYHVSAEELAYLALAQKVAILVSFVLMVINLVMAPRFAALWADGQIERLRVLARKAAWLSGAISLPVVLVLALASGPVLQTLGSDYVNAVTVLQLFLIGQLANAITGPAIQLLLMSGREKRVRNLNLASGTFSILAGLLVIPHAGIVGAAAVSALTMIVSSFWGMEMVHRDLGMRLLVITSHRDRIQ